MSKPFKNSDPATVWHAWSPIETAPLADGPAPQSDGVEILDDAIDDAARVDLHTMLGEYLLKSLPDRFADTVSLWETYDAARAALDVVRHRPADIREVAAAEQDCLKACNAFTAEASAAFMSLRK